MTIPGLRKVSGMSFEEVTEVLTRGGIRNNSFKVAKKNARYFIDSEVQIDEKDKDKVIARLPMPPEHYGRYGIFYYARYEPQPGFDIRSLDGIVVFERGILVERTYIRYKNA